MKKESLNGPFCRKHWIALKALNFGMLMKMAEPDKELVQKGMMKNGGCLYQRFLWKDYPMPARNSCNIDGNACIKSSRLLLQSIPKSFLRWKFRMHILMHYLRYFLITNIMIALSF